MWMVDDETVAGDAFLNVSISRTNMQNRNCFQK